MNKVQGLGGVGGANGGGCRFFFARITRIKKEDHGKKYYLELIDPPRSFAGVATAHLVGSIPPDIKVGYFVKVSHWQKDGFSLKGMASEKEALMISSKPITLQGTAAPPLLSVEQLAAAQYIQLAPTDPRLEVKDILFESGHYLTQQPPRILKNGWALMIPPGFMAASEKYKLGDIVDFIGLKSKITGNHDDLCCTRGFYEFMAKIKQMMKEGRFFSADTSQTEPVNVSEARSPVLAKLDPAKVAISRVFAKEIAEEFNYRLGVLYVRNINEISPGRIYFRLSLETYNDLTGEHEFLDPRKATVLEMIEALVKFNFRAIVTGSVAPFSL
jgi:hypothetical protein